jgi:DNA-binding TFAR19-related protein (PDSD5 family)
LFSDKKYKQEVAASIKALMKNLVKLTNLTKVISNEKISKIMNKTKSDAGILKKIVEVHTGFTKEDVILKLN